MEKSFHKLIFGTLVAGLLLPALVVAAGFHDKDTPPCYDITGQTTAVLVAGVNNGGIMDFNDASVGVQWQACVRMKADLSGPDRLEGWVHNSNLGWVSLYCPGGAGAQNLGISCGDKPYSVAFQTIGAAPDFDSVKLSGYAWGDNIGYLSFNGVVASSGDNYQMVAVASGSNRGLVESTPFSLGSSTWTETVGWLDWTGVRFNWEDLIVPEEVLPEGEPEDYIIIKGPDEIPDADGKEGYDIEIPFVDKGKKTPDNQIEQCPNNDMDVTSVPGQQGKTYCAKIELKWEDGVDYDQTTQASQNQGENLYGDNNRGAVRKPYANELFGDLGSPDRLLYNATKTAWVGRVTSFAPTSDRNMLDSFENEKFYYPAQVNDYNGSLTGQNLLKLKGLKLLFMKYAAAGQPAKCIYGELKGGRCVMKDYMKAGGTMFSFNPLVEVKKMAHVLGDKEFKFINIMAPDQLQKFKYQAVSKSAAQFPGLKGYMGMQDNGVYDMKFVTDPVEKKDDAKEDVQLNINGQEQILNGQVFYDPSKAASLTDVGAYLYTLAEYTLDGHSIKYFSGKLPRIKAGILINPVARVQGNVYVTDFGQKAADVSLRSLGNVSSNLRREAILRNVSKYLAGKTVTTNSNGIGVNDLMNISGLNELVPGKVYYLKGGNLTIGCEGGVCSFAKNITLIVENGSIFLNSNLIPSDGKSQIGLIALRDLDKQAPKNQGFLYLDKDVTHLKNTHIYLDRVLQSYDKAMSKQFDANGFIKFNGDDYERQQAFRNQLVIEGSISSMNGIGNAVANGKKVTDETGAVVSSPDGYCSNYAGQTLSGMCRARGVDLNYLRYYGPGLEICTGLESPNAKANVPRDQALRGDAAKDYGCNNEKDGYDIDPKNLYNAANSPAGDLVKNPNNGKQSGYFNCGRSAIGGCEDLSKQGPVYFYYKAISKDLAGFEQVQSVNQLIQN